jgi:hypothetical protein
MTMAKMTDEQLVAVLCESDWYIRLCKEWATRDVEDPMVSLGSWVHYRSHVRTFAAWTEPYITEMLALIQEIESDKPWGAWNVCAICSGHDPANVSRQFNPKDTSQPFDPRDLYVCVPCYKSTAGVAMEKLGLKDGTVWTAGQMARFVTVARRLEGGSLFRSSKVDPPVVPASVVVPVPKPSWAAYLAQERNIANCQKAIDRDAHLRAELDRPMVKPKYPRPLVSGDLLDNPWNRWK